jgi:hypothetical protein
MDIQDVAKTNFKMPMTSQLPKKFSVLNATQGIRPCFQSYVKWGSTGY